MFVKQYKTVNKLSCPCRKGHPFGSSQDKARMESEEIFNILNSEAKMRDLNYEKV